MSERVHLDARRLLCPMPVIKTQNRIAELESGAELEVLCTDPGVLHDIPAWCRVNGHEVVDSGRRGNEIYVVVRVQHDEITE